MKKIENKKDGDGRKTRLKPAEIFEKIKDSLSNQTTHPEAHFLRKFPWEGMLTIRFESKEFLGQKFRSDFVEELMKNIIHFKFLLRSNDVYWIAVTEYGDSDCCHVHILFNFLPWERKGHESPVIENLAEESLESLHHVCDRRKIPTKSVDLNWQPSFDDFGLVGYVTKLEPGRSEKHFHWSPAPEKWILEPLEEAEAGKGRIQ